MTHALDRCRDAGAAHGGFNTRSVGSLLSRDGGNGGLALIRVGRRRQSSVNLAEQAVEARDAGLWNLQDQYRGGQREVSTHDVAWLVHRPTAVANRAVALLDAANVGIPREVFGTS